MSEKKSFDVKIEDENGLRLAVTVPMTEDQVMNVIRPMSAELVLIAVKQLSSNGLEEREALRLASYAVLVQAYGRDFVRDALSLAVRTEARYWATVREILAAVADEPGPEIQDLVIRAQRAYEEQRKAEA